MLRFPSSPNVAADLVTLFRDGLQRSRVTKGESVIVYADTFTLPAYPAAFLAAARDCGAEAIQIIQPLMPNDLSQTVGRAKPTRLIIEAMKQADFVVDVSTGGMLYSYEQSAILAAGTRMLRVREPDDCLLRLRPSEEIKDRAMRGVQRYAQAKQVRLVFEDGSVLTMDRGDRAPVTQYGMADEKGRWDHWGTGLICIPPVEESVSGTLVISQASILFPFETYMTQPAHLHFRDGVLVDIEGGREARMLRDFIDRQGDAGARRLSHVGWGLEHRARWETLAMRGWDNAGGVESRSVYGNILVALGENGDLGGNNTSKLHIDIALRGGRLELDGEPIVEDGRFVAAGVA
jgi:2,5-dihydroxypyridine 5,6-dioxygenase